MTGSSRSQSVRLYLLLLFLTFPATLSSLFPIHLQSLSSMTANASANYGTEHGLNSQADIRPLLSLLLLLSTEMQSKIARQSGYIFFLFHPFPLTFLRYVLLLLVLKSEIDKFRPEAQ